jgi:radical SAM protein with 4Fe4S-binding SPASM domain
MNTCPAAFNQLYLHSSGKVYPCSFLQNDHRYVLGDIANQTLEEIWKSDKIENFRKEHLLHNSNSRCSSNQKKFLCDKLNTRSFFDNNDYKLKRIDIMLDSFCNLVCIMCTNIYDETGGFQKKFFWENNDFILSSLQEIELVGGEPVISSYFYKLIDKVQKNNNTIEWKITTNANYPITPRLTDYLNKIKFTTFAVSLDSLSKEIFEKIRQKSNHSLVMNNIDILIPLINNLSINMVVQQLNYLELTQMYLWAANKGLRFYPILLTAPEDHSLLSLPTADLEKITTNLIAENEVIKSIEIFFIIRKIIKNSELKNNIDIINIYHSHLMSFKKEDVIDE